MIDVILVLLLVIGFLLVSVQMFTVVCASIGAFFVSSKKQHKKQIKEQAKERIEFEKELDTIQEAAEKELNKVLVDTEKGIDIWLDT